MPKAPCRINASLKAGQRPAFLFNPGGEIEVGDAERLHKQHLSSEWTFMVDADIEGAGRCFCDLQP